jgi:hypothetical protein
MRGKPARPVLRGPRRSNAPGLPDRDIRMAKLQQKISGGWRTLAGAQRFCRLRSYVATARKQQVGVLAALRRVFEGDPWLPAAADP